MAAERCLASGARLPDECLLLIAQYCEPSLLKRFRLASTTTSALGLTYLFESIRLVPNTDCLTAFVHTFKDSPARFAIRTLIYDLSWETTISDLIARCDSAKSDPSPDTSKSRLAAWTHKVDIGQLRHIYNSRLAGPSVCPDESAHLNSVLSYIPRASRLVVVSDSYDRDYNRQVPYFYQSMLSTVDMLEARSSLLLPLGPGTDDGSHLRSMLSAIKESQTPLLRLTLQDAKWSSLGSHVAFGPSCKTAGKLSLWKCVLQNLVHLDLSFRGSLSRQSVDSIKPLRRFLRACSQVKTLRLSFNEPNQRRYGHDQRMCSYLGPLLSPGSSTRPLMPCLDSLLLRNTTTSQHDLVKFLSIHAKSLKKLRLVNIALLRHDGQDRKSCWVEAIKSFQSVLSLTQVEFAGWLTNGGRQKWYVSENAADSGRLRPRIQSYIMDKSTKICPLEKMAIPAGYEDVEEPPRGMDEFGGDWTWTMLYPGKGPRHYMTEQVFSGDHFFSEDLSRRPSAGESLASSSARLRYLHAAAGQHSPPPTEPGMPWPESYQQPPAKKIKSTHTPISIPSPSIWSSSPEAWDSSTSSSFDPPVMASSKVATSFVSKAPNFTYTTQSVPMQASGAQKFGLSHAFWGGPKPPTATFGWPATNKSAQSWVYEADVITDGAWTTSGTFATAPTNIAPETTSANTFPFFASGYKHVGMLGACEIAGVSTPAHHAAATAYAPPTLATSQPPISTSGYTCASSSVPYQETLDCWWMGPGESKSDQMGMPQSTDFDWQFPGVFAAGIGVDMEVDGEPISQGKGKGKANAW